MITCYFQCLYCIISPPTQFLQLSPRLVPSIVSMSGFFFYLFVCFWNFSTPLPHCPPSPTLKKEKQESRVHCLIVCNTESSWRERENYARITSSCWCKRCFPSLLVFKQQQAHTSHVQMAKHSCISAIQEGLCAPGSGHTPLVSVNSIACTVFTSSSTFFFFLNSWYPLEAQIRSANCRCLCVFKGSILRLALFKCLPEVLFESLIPEGS